MTQTKQRLLVRKRIFNRNQINKFLKGITTKAWLLNHGEKFVGHTNVSICLLYCNSDP
jgi:hypothetical protein